MKYLFVETFNPKIVEQLENVHKNVKYEDPVFEHHDRLKEYIDTLQYEEDTVREMKVTQWIKPVLNQRLNLWRTKFSENSELIKNALSEKNKIETKRNQNIRRVGEIDTDVEKTQKEIAQKEQDKQQYYRDGLQTQKIDIKAERLKVSLLLIFSVIVAIGTYVYFANSQSAIYWTTMPAAEKVGIVKTYILEGSQTYINAFSDSINIPENRDLTLADLNGIDISNINQAPKPSLLQYFSKDPTVIFLAAGAFMLILMGKITAIVYEKLKSPNWMFFLNFILAFLVLTGAVFAMASITKKDTQLNALRTQIAESKQDIKREQDNSFSFGSGFEDETEESPELKKLKSKLVQQEEEYAVIKTSFNNFKFSSIILFMFTELLIGSLAWITHAEYIEKRMELKTGTQGHVDLVIQEIEYLENKIKTLLEEKNELENVNNLAADLIHRINAALSDIISTEKIEHLAQDFMEQEIELAKQILQKARYEWVNKNPKLK